MERAVSSQTRQLGKQSAELERTASAVERTTTEIADAADRRTVLATDRTYLASERTYAAWMRTALAALAAGVGARTLLHDLLPGWAGKVSASALVIFAGFCLVAAVWRQLQGVVPPPHPDIRPIPTALLVPTSVVLMFVTIAVLAGIWAA